jgi:hypothetical protein
VRGIITDSSDETFDGYIDKTETANEIPRKQTVFRREEVRKHLASQDNNLQDLNMYKISSRLNEMEREKETKPHP